MGERILVVDDEPDILLMLRVGLEAAGFEVLLAADGRSALDRVEATCPDLVVLDVMMPVMDGWEVLDRLRTLDDPPPVVVVSAKSSDADVVTALDLGAVDYVTKPFDQASLVELLRTVLAAGSGEREDHRRALLRRYRAR